MATVFAQSSPSPILTSSTRSRPFIRGRERALVAQQLVGRDRQIANALSGAMIDRVGDRGGSSDNADFADTFDTERIDLVVFLVDEDHVDGMDIRVHRDVIVSEIVRHETAEPM